MAPHPTIMAAVVADRLKQARAGISAQIPPLNNPFRVAEGLAMLDYWARGQPVVAFLRGTVNKDQTLSINPT